ncbi:hypothetical protein Gohar_002742, partial [Gossypium harknessii]|nr:hypothetical protein [Gossypium harknessii]
RGINGLVTGITFSADSVKKKILLKPKDRNAPHLRCSGSEKHEKRVRNKDRLDHGVWSPLHCFDVQKASEERLTSSVLQSAQAYHNPSEGINASAHEYLLTQGEMKSSILSGSSGHNIPLEND